MARGTQAWLQPGAGSCRQARQTPCIEEEEARLRDEHPDLEIRRVILEQDLKREYQEFLQKESRTTEIDSIEPPQRRHFSTTWRRPRVLMKRW
jgi:hypothetical protein